MRIVLVEPEIPPNTGNIARLCAAFDICLNLVRPLGFSLEDKYLKRAGCDYWAHVNIKIWPSWASFLEEGKGASRLVLATTKGEISLPSFRFQKEDVLVFGPESRGLSPEILALSPNRVRIPTFSMAEGGVRSLNLSTTVGIFLYTGLAACNLPPVGPSLPDTHL